MNCLSNCFSTCGTQNHKPLTTRARCPRDVPCVDCAQLTGAGPEDTQSLLKAVGRDEEPSRAYPEPRGKTQSTHSLPDGVSPSQWAGVEVGRWVEPWMDRQGDGAVDGHTDCAGAERESVELRKTKSPVCLPTTHFTEEGPSIPEEGPQPPRAALCSDSTSSALSLTRRPLAPLNSGSPGALL